MDLEENAEVDRLIQLIKMTDEVITMLEYQIPNVREIANNLQRNNIKADIQSMKFIMLNEIEKFQQFKEIFKQELNKCCVHTWEDDHIDSLNYECKRITYCTKCNETKCNETKCNETKCNETKCNAIG